MQPTHLAIIGDASFFSLLAKSSASCAETWPSPSASIDPTFSAISSICVTAPPSPRIGAAFDAVSTPSKRVVVVGGNIQSKDTVAKLLSATRHGKHETINPNDAMECSVRSLSGTRRLGVSTNYRNRYSQLPIKPTRQNEM